MSADHPQAAAIADHDELPAALDHVKAASTHFRFKPAAPDLAFYPPYASPHHATALRGFGTEYLLDPSVGIV
ncbi:MAG: hypothetical protein HKN02_15025, partial [Rhodobacteraceae bacterium]|nr:hypothetical protein [Paracoccaceae bacterium]